MTNRRKIQTAKEVVSAERAKLSKCEADQITAQAELASLEQRSGQEFLDDLSTAEDLAASMQGLRDRSNILERAIAAQRGRVQAAESAYLHVEADELERAVDAARGRLVAHDRRTEELLAQLEEHEGTFVPEHRDLGVIYEGQGPMGGRKSAALQSDLAQAEARVRILRDLAAGVDPSVWLREQQSAFDGTVAGVEIRDLYPACVWGPDAVVPAPAYLRSVQASSQLETSPIAG